MLPTSSGASEQSQSLSPDTPRSFRHTSALSRATNVAVGMQQAGASSQPAVASSAQGVTAPGGSGSASAPASAHAAAPGYHAGYMGMPTGATNAMQGCFPGMLPGFNPFAQMQGMVPGMFPPVEMYATMAKMMYQQQAMQQQQMYMMMQQRQAQHQALLQQQQQQQQQHAGKIGTDPSQQQAQQSPWPTPFQQAPFQNQQHWPSCVSLHGTTGAAAAHAMYAVHSAPAMLARANAATPSPAQAAARLIPDHAHSMVGPLDLPADMAGAPTSPPHGASFAPGLPEAAILPGDDAATLAALGLIQDSPSHSPAAAPTNLPTDTAGLLPGSVSDETAAAQCGFADVASSPPQGHGFRTFASQQTYHPAHDVAAVLQCPPPPPRLHPITTQPNGFGSAADEDAGGSGGAGPSRHTPVARTRGSSRSLLSNGAAPAGAAARSSRSVRRSTSVTTSVSASQRGLVEVKTEPELTSEQTSEDPNARVAIPAYTGTGSGEGMQGPGMVVYVSARRAAAILKRREQRAKLEAEGRGPQHVARARKPYLHQSRHDHAQRRIRGPGGRFLSAQETAALLRAQEQEGGGPSASETNDPTVNNAHDGFLAVDSTNPLHQATAAAPHHDTTNTHAKGSYKAAAVKLEAAVAAGATGCDGRRGGPSGGRGKRSPPKPRPGSPPHDQSTNESSDPEKPPHTHTHQGLAADGSGTHAGGVAGGSGKGGKSAADVAGGGGRVGPSGRSPPSRKNSKANTPGSTGSGQRSKPQRQRSDTVATTTNTPLTTTTGMAANRGTNRADTGGLDTLQDPALAPLDLSHLEADTAVGGGYLLDPPPVTLVGTLHAAVTGDDVDEDLLLLMSGADIVQDLLWDQPGHGVGAGVGAHSKASADSGAAARSGPAAPAPASGAKAVLDNALGSAATGRASSDSGPVTDMSVDTLDRKVIVP